MYSIFNQIWIYNDRLVLISNKFWHYFTEYVFLKAAALIYNVVYIRISSYLFKLTANQFNHNILCPYWICFFIGKSESGIWGPWLQTKKFDILPTVAIFVDASKINKKYFFEKDFKRPEMELSAFTMKEQTHSRAKRNILELFGVNSKQ